MKFKYIGDLPIKDVDLVLAGIFKPNDSIVKGTVFEVPDEDTVLINRVQLGGVYEEYVEPKKPSKPKFKKKSKETDEEVEEDE